MRILTLDEVIELQRLALADAVAAASVTEAAT